MLSVIGTILLLFFLSLLFIICKFALIAGQFNVARNLLYIIKGSKSLEFNVVCLSLAASSQSTTEPSVVQLYQVLDDICSQHIDTHHHFFIANSNTYVHLPRLLNFTNHVDETFLVWLGKLACAIDFENKSTYFLSD